MLTYADAYMQIYSWLRLVVVGACLRLYTCSYAYTKQSSKPARSRVGVLVRVTLLCVSGLVCAMTCFSSGGDGIKAEFKGGAQACRFGSNYRGADDPREQLIRASLDRYLNRALIEP